MINRRHFFGFVLLTAAMLLTGCSAEILDGGSQGLVPIELTASVQEGMATGGTRAGTELNNSYLPSATNFTVGFSKNTTLGSNTTTYQTTNAAGATKCTGTQPYFTLGGASTTVYAYYPSKPGTTFSVQTAQNTDANYSSSDLMYATKSLTKASPTATADLSFGHKMAKIIVNATIGSGITSITAVKIVGGYRTVNVSDATTCTLGTTLTNANSSTNITVYSGTHTSGTLSCAALIPPQTVTGNFLQIDTDAGTVTYSLNGKQFDSNNVYTFNVTLTASQAGTTVAITNWANNSNATVTVGGGNLALSSTSASLAYKGGNGTVNVTEGSVSGINASSANGAIATASATGSVVTITPVAVGNTQVLVYGVKDGKMLSSVVNVTVGKGTPTVTAPTYVSTALTYNSSEQTLITAGSSSEGTTMKYALGSSSAVTGEWGTSLPKATNAGTYYVWYKVDGGTNYNDVSATIISGGKAIGKATPTLTLSTNSLTFTSLNSEKTFTITYDGDGTLSATSSNSSYATASLSSKTVTVTSKAYGSATITVSAAAGANYTAATNKTVSVEIASCTGTALASATVGMVICEHGKAHTATTGALSCGGTKVAVVGYVNGSSGYALALQDASDQTWNEIVSQGTKNENCPLAEGKRGSVPAAPTGTAWKVLNKANYEAVFVAMGSTTGDSDGKTYDSNVNSKITAAGGSGLSGGYWSSQEDDAGRGWNFYESYWYGNNKGISSHVRPALAW